MPPNVITLEATSPGNWGQAVAQRQASNRILVAASAGSEDLPVAAGYLFAYLKILFFPDYVESNIITLLSGMVWKYNQPTWQGHIPLSDQMTIIAIAAGVGTETINFNLTFADLTREDSIDQYI